VGAITRKLYHLHRLLDLFERHGTELAVVTDPSFGESAAHRLTSNIIAAASEFQLEMTRERMADARAALKRQGRRVAGRVPFGYRAERQTKQLVIDPDEAVVVRRMFELGAGGIRPQEMFDQVRAFIEARRSRVPSRTAPTINWPLRGLLVCGECGRVMSPSVSGYKNLEYRYYRCRSRALGRPPCKNVGISAFEIEEFVRTTLCSESFHLVDTAAAAQMQEFLTAWRRLDARQQMVALADVLNVVRFDPNGGTISVTLADGALERIGGG